MFSAKYPAKKYRNGEHVDVGAWLFVIHEANRISDGMFGAPDSSGPWWAGGEVEEYEHARVVHHNDADDTVSIVAKTEHGSHVLELADATVRNEQPDRW